MRTSSSRSVFPTNRSSVFSARLKPGVSARELCRKHAVSDATFYTWRKKYGDMEVPEVKCLKSLEEENARLRKLLAKAMLDKEALQVAPGQKY